MADLYPTKTRLELLRDVAAGEVYCARQATGRQQVLSFLRGGRMVTRRAGELEAAGWIKKGPFESASLFSRRYYELTDRGRRVLEEADRG